MPAPAHLHTPDRRPGGAVAALACALALVMTPGCFKDLGPNQETTLGTSTSAPTSSGSTEGSTGGCESEGCTESTTTGMGEGCEPAPADACLVPSEHPTIQEALDSPFCDVIWLAPLVFSENITISEDVTIASTCPETATIDGNLTGSAIRITEGDVLLKNLVIVGGLAQEGGGIYKNAADTLTLMRTRVSGNTARNGGGIFHQGGALVLEESQVTMNTATIQPEDVSGGVNSAAGGGVYAYVSTVALNSGSTISGNTLTSDAPMLLLRGAGMYAEGGALVSIRDGAEVSDNTLEITGLDGSAGQGGGLAVTKVTALNIEDARVNGNQILATGDDGLELQGGGLWMLETETSIVRSELASNRVEISDAVLGIRNARGGGVFAGGGSVFSSQLTVTESSITSNTAISPGEASGGGMFTWTNEEGDELTVFLIRSTLEGNRAEAEAYARGGGVFVSTNAASSDVTFNARNSTLSGNNAAATQVGLSNADGGGLYAEQLEAETSVTIELSNMTITSNTANTQGGGLALGSSSGLNVQMRNTIVAANAAGEGSDCDGTLISDGHNLLGEIAGCSLNADISDILGAAPQLGPLADNDGPTRTHALMESSPAVDAGALTDCSDENGAPLETDQRNLPREAGDFCDIGAYERQ